MQKQLLPFLPRRRLISAAAALATFGLVTGCSKTPEPPAPTPAVAVLPGTTLVPDAAASAPTVAAVPAAADIASASSGMPVTESAGRGTVSVITGTLPAPAPAADPTPRPAAVEGAGLPPARTASLPGASSMGPASAPANDQPSSVSPGTK